MNKLAIAAWATVAWSGVVHAAVDPVLTQASVNLSDLSYTVSSVYPDGGVAPSFSLSSAFGTMSVSTTNESDHLPGTLFSNDAKTINLATGTVSKTSGGLAADMTVHASDLPYYDTGSDTYRTNVVVSSSSPFYRTDWQLAAFTSVVIHGTLTVQASADVAALSDHPMLTASGSTTLLQLSTDALFDLKLVPNWDSGNLQTSGSLSNNEAYSGGSISSAGVRFDSTLQSYTQDFDLVFTNNTSMAMSGYIDSSISLTSTLSHMTALPEPGTWALMGLGLGLLGWRVGRERRLVQQ